MTDPLLRSLEQELTHLRHLRDTVLEILDDSQLAPPQKLEALAAAFQTERDQDEEAEDTRDRERLS